MAKIDWRVAFPRKWSKITNAFHGTRRIDTRSLAAARKAEFEIGLSDKLMDLYTTAAADLYRTSNAYFSKFADRDAEMLARLNAGEIDDSYYRSWRTAQLGRGERWETMAGQMADNMTNVNQRAAALINNTTPEIYALNHDYTLYHIDKLGAAGDISFTLTNERAVRETLGGANHVEFRVNSIDPIRDYVWNRQQIERQLALGILKGDSIDGIAAGFLTVMQRNEYAAIRNARTAVTSAYNAGNQAAMEEAEALGIELKKQWMSTNDGRTRDSHVELNGETVGVNETFSNGLAYPCDPTGDPSEVYNCRCTMITVLPELEEYKQNPDKYKDEIDDFFEGEETDEEFEKWREEQRRRQGGLFQG